MKNKYYAFMLDVVKSKDMNDELRAKCQKKLVKVINFVNELYNNSLKEKIVFTGGDCVQGLFMNCLSALNCYLLCKALLYPFAIRCGIGGGNINEQLLSIKESDPKVFNSNVIDGDAYHYAVNALTNCKYNRYDICVYTNDSSNDVIINQMFHTIMIFENNQTSNQKDIYNVFNLLYPIIDEAFVMNISYYQYLISSINDNITKYDFVKEYNDDIINWYHQYIDNPYKLLPNLTYLQTKRVIDSEVFPPSMNELVANCFNVKRQNIEQLKSSGKYVEIRKIMLSILIYVKKYY